jgi:hypothetical protein
MSSVSITPEVLDDLERAAAEQQTSVEVVLSEAVERYLWDLRRRAIARESAMYRRQHATLLRDYDGLYIALRNGVVVDSDADEQETLGRVRRAHGDAAVMITRVTATPTIMLSRRGFALADDGA